MRPGEVLSPRAGEIFTCIRSSDDGGVFVFEMELGPQGRGPPMHSHDDDEGIEVLDGEIVFEVRGEAKTLRRGDALTLPAGTPHRFWNPSRSQPVRCTVTHGARFERALAQPDLTRMAMYLTFVDPGASRMTSPFVRAVLYVVAQVGRLRGRSPLPST